jgi:hypothetical protein
MRERIQIVKFSNGKFGVRRQRKYSRWSLPPRKMVTEFSSINCSYWWEQAEHIREYGMMTLEEAKNTYAVQNAGVDCEPYDGSTNHV